MTVCEISQRTWRVSADTKTCGSPLYPAPTGGLRLPADKHTGILTDFQTKVNKKISSMLDSGYWMLDTCAGLRDTREKFYRRDR